VPSGDDRLAIIYGANPEASPCTPLGWTLLFTTPTFGSVVVVFWLQSRDIHLG
jgi:hypothetical protein